MEFTPRIKKGDFVYIIGSQELSAMRMNEFIGRKGVVNEVIYKLNGNSGCWVAIAPEGDEWWIPVESIFVL